jgi:hypothetical protein
MKTPATDRWVKDALEMLGEPGLDSANNYYAYRLRQFETTLPLLAGVLIPLFAREPRKPWYRN